MVTVGSAKAAYLAGRKAYRDGDTYNPHVDYGDSVMWRRGYEDEKKEKTQESKA